jgi:hypothetical protein
VNLDVDGITIETSVLPAGWIHRLVPEVDPGSGATAWCLDPHDLSVAKLIAGRPKDLDFVRISVTARLVDPRQVHISLSTVVDPRTTIAIARIEALTELGLPSADVDTWWKRRRQALNDRLRRSTEPSPADVLDALGPNANHR